MKKYFLFFGFVFLLLSNISAQYEMEYEDPTNQWEPVSPHKNIFRIDSLSKLPSDIQLHIKNNFSIMLGNLTDCTTFYQGQIYDLEAIFKADPNVHKLHMLLPKYDLYFMIRDTSIGLIRYNLHLQLDEYGQIIQVNWPRNYYNDRSKFMPRDSIEKFAVEQGKLKGYIYHDSLYSEFEKHRYHISFRFDPAKHLLVWMFYFDDPIKTDSYWMCWNVLEVNCLYYTVTDEYPICYTPYY